MRNLVLQLSLASAAWAADTTGTVRGAATDPAGAAVAGARMELIHDGTNISYRQTSGLSGEYVFNLVPPGTYTLRASKEGFRAHSVSGVIVLIGTNTTINIEFQIGAVAQAVEVSASADVIDTASARVGTSVPQRYITELPSSTRNPLTFAEMAPGVVLVRTQSQSTLSNQGTGANVNGMRQGANVYYLDGSENTGAWRNMALQFPNPDTVQEVQVSTANTSAEFGKQPGGIFNVITKSGTNEFHGSAFYFFHHDALNANTWARNASGTARAEDVLKQIGGTAGGPVRRNKTFFFASFMVHTDRTARFQNTAKFLTPAMLQGDFSQFPRPVYDSSGQPLPRNQIPRSLMDPVTLRLSELLPAAAVYGERFNWAYNEPARNHETLAKISHQFSPANQLEVSFLRTWGHVDYPGTDSSNNQVPSFGPQTYKASSRNLSVRHTWVASASTILQSRFATAGHLLDRQSAQTGRNLSDFGARWPDAAQGARKYLPNIVLSDGFRTAQGNLGPLDQYNIHFGTTLTHVAGSHNLKFGAAAQRDTFRLYNDQDQATFTFDGSASSRPAGAQPQGVGVFGYSAADFLLGRASTFSVNGLQDQRVFGWSNFFFAQDEWRIRRRITLTLGARYEFYTPTSEIKDRASQFMPGHMSDRYPRAPLGLAFLGDTGVRRGFTAPDHNNLAPRVGLVVDPSGGGKTAIRAGFGVYYSNIALQQKLFSAQGVPWAPTANGGQTLNMTDPWGSSQSIRYSQPPTPFSTDVNTYNYPAVINNLYQYGERFATPYTLAWTGSFEREVAAGVKIWAGYVANRGFSFVQLFDGNLPVWQPNATLQNIQARRPYAGYGVVRLLLTRARSWYDAFQFTTDARLGKGFSARFAYSFAGQEAYAPEDFGSGGFVPSNPLNANGERAPEGMRHIGRMFFVYDLPWLNGGRGTLPRLLGNWRVSGSVFASTGTPMTVLLGQDYNFDGVNQNSGSYGDRPDLVGPVRYTSGSRDERSARYFDPSSFRLPSSRAVFGTEPRNALRGPGQWSGDLALLKNVPLGEGKEIQVRAEAYNFLNHASLTNPNTNMASTEFTKIVTRNGNRTMQIGVRFRF